MTRNEIKAAISRIKDVCASDVHTYAKVASALMGGIAGCEFTVFDFCAALIELLEQADPDTHIELPVDADGIPIGIGDTMRLSDGKTVVVDAVCDDGFVFHDSIAWLMHAETAHHLHTARVEDVLRDFAMELGSIVDDDTLVGYADRLRGLRRDEVRLD